MSVSDVLARIGEIHSAIAPPAATTATHPAGDFAAALGGATAAGTATQMALASTRPALPAATAPAALAYPATVPGFVPPSPVTPAATGGGDVPAALEPLVRAAAAQAGVDPALVAAVARQESGFDPGAVSPAGAQGLMQLMPGTARELGVTDPHDPSQSLAGGARYLRQQLDRFGGDTSLALAAYNAGPGAVQRAGGIPPYAETQAYVTKVLGYYDAYRASGL